MSNNRKKKPFIMGKKVKNDHQQDPSKLQVVDPFDSSLPLPSFNTFYACCLIACLAIACYINSLPGEFVFDDVEAITGNQDLLPNTSFSALFHHDFWGTPIDSIHSHKSYRPLTVLSFKLNSMMMGKLNAQAFHWVNIILHAIICIQYYFFARTLFTACIHPFPHGQQSHDGQTISTPLRAPFLAALIFTIHPIHTECVASIVGRAELLAAIFYFLAFSSYQRSLQTEFDEDGRPQRVQWSYQILTLIFAAIAMLCKEQGITIMGFCLVYDLLINCRFHPFLIFRSSSSYSSMNEKQNSWVRSLLYRALFVLLGTSSAIYFRYLIMKSGPPQFRPSDNPASFEESRFIRMLNYNYIYTIHAWLLISPNWLCFDWSMGCIPLIKTVFDYRCLFPVLFWIIMAIVICSNCSSNKPSSRLINISLACAIIPFIPASNILFRVGFVIAERVLYLPSVGYCILLTYSFCVLSRREGLNKAILAGIVVLLIGYTCKTVKRNTQWLNSEALFVSALDICPLNAKVHYNIGKVYSDSGKELLAEEYYRKAISLEPNYEQALNNLGNLLKDRKAFDEAEQYLKRAVQLRKDFAAAWMNLGIVQSDLGKFKEAENSLRTATVHRSYYPDAYYNLGNLYIATNELSKSEAAFIKAISQTEHHKLAWNNLVLMLFNTGNLERAERYARRGIQENANFSEMHHLLGNVLGKQKKYKEAIHHFELAMLSHPDDPALYANLGVVYHLNQNPTQAEFYYKKALSIDPHFKTARDNISKLKREKPNVG
ncbi:Transmembrane and TPR repeat-containing protein 4 [Trichoplax sp. H2]|nr:Transmembrane and TPR repeat-containing protein 4 [Trichoplax sp. H2]|eukprot:RDD41284.1 Transmembrane and TPR repeat-containing protein 4 [Trichoplax sp. H2]